MITISHTAITPRLSTVDAHVDADVMVGHHGENVVRVSVDGRTVGFIETVGPLFVSLAGHRHDRAVEVGQSHALESAIDVLAPR